MPGKFHYDQEQGGGPTTASIVEERSFRKMDDPTTRVHIGMRWNGIKWIPHQWETKEAKRPTAFK